MKLWLVIVATAVLLGLGGFGMMLAIFAGGGYSYITGTKATILNWSIFILPASSLFALLILWMGFLTSQNPLYYLSLGIPVLFIFLYFAFLKTI